MRVTGLHVYPVKSMGGPSVPAAAVEPWGLAGDRRFGVIDPDGNQVTAGRGEHGMVTVSARWVDGRLLLGTADGHRLEVTPALDGPEVTVGYTRLDRARHVGAAADEWLSRVFDRPLRLVWQDDPRRRPVSAEHGGTDGDTLSLADAGPLLLTSEASLGRLRTLIDDGSKAIGMDRFRPNVVVDGDRDQPFAEESWDVVRIGSVDFRATELCDRCVVTTIDPATGTRAAEPLRALTRHRRIGGLPRFGVRLVPLDTGTIEVGDPVRPS